jgi:hypothetical protein
MKLLVKIVDDDGKVLAEHEADACQPSMWRAAQKLQGKMPQISDQDNTGTYELFGITFQPHVRVDRPNGWTAPAPQPSSPVNGRPPTQNSFPSFPNFPSRGKFAPKTTAPQTNAGRAPGLRG